MKRTAKFAAALVAGTMLLTACSGETPAPTTPPTTTETASPSGNVVLYTSEPQAKIDEVIAAFNVHYPEVKVDVFRAGTGDLNARVESEITAQGAPQADIFLAADVPTFEGYVKRDLFLKYVPTDADKLIQDILDPEGFYVGTRIIPTVIAYNTGVIKTPPTSWKELTDAQYKDKLVMPNPDVSGAAAYNAAVWLDDADLGINWLKALAANKPVIADSNGPVSQAIASGAQPVGIVVDYLVRDLAAKGSPIAVSYPSEGVPYVSQPAGIFANTKVAELAKLFVDFLVSEEGQKIAVKQAYLPIRSDVGTPEGAPAMSDIKLMSPDQDRIASIKKDAVAQFNELFK
ncbi:MAG: ABC transporter substrate-binding protein [Microbacteriaceae bacterium]